MPKLAVNVDHVATIRQARKANEPDPVVAAMLSELAGASGIIVHLREDRRHIQDRDLEVLKKVVKTHLNLEMAPTSEMVQKALEVHPDMVTLVPERREELTTEGGLDVLRNKETLKKIVDQLKEAEILVSLFIDPDLDQIKASHYVGAQYIEIHTGTYCNAINSFKREEEYKKIINGVKLAQKLGFIVKAGHGLDYKNVRPIAEIPGIEELSIGHSIISRAIFVGIEKAVKEMLELIK